MADRELRFLVCLKIARHSLACPRSSRAGELEEGEHGMRTFCQGPSSPHAWHALIMNKIKVKQKKLRCLIEKIGRTRKMSSNVENGES